MVSLPLQHAVDRVSVLLSAQGRNLSASAKEISSASIAAYGIVLTRLEGFSVTTTAHAIIQQVFVSVIRIDMGHHVNIKPALLSVGVSAMVKALATLVLLKARSARRAGAILPILKGRST